MTESSAPTYSTGPARGELPLAAALLAVLALVELGASGALAMFGRGPWQDEVYSCLLCTDPSILHSMKALAHGADAQGPMFYLLGRGFGALFGGASLESLRWMGFMSVWLAVVGVYAILRMVVDRISALAGALVVWAHPLVIVVAFDARTYGPVMAAAVWLCWGLAQKRKTGVTRAVLAICSVLLCALHYFGLAAWGAAIGGYWLTHRKEERLKLADWCALAAGPVALLGCVPVLMGRYGTLGNSTWVSGALFSVSNFFYDLLPAPVLIIPPVFFLIAVVLHKLRPRFEGRSFAPAAALGALGLMPVAIVVFSLMAQPSMVPRYGLAGVAALAVPAAWLISRVRRGLAICACSALVILGTAEMRFNAKFWVGFAANNGRRITDVRRFTGNETVVFVSPMDLLPMVEMAPDLRGRCDLWGVPPDGDEPQQGPRLFQTRMARVLQSYYGIPKVIERTQMEGLDHYYVVVWGIDPQLLAGELPDFSLTRVPTGDGLLLYSAARSPARLAAGKN
jgi:hypothetical protein